MRVLLLLRLLQYRRLVHRWLRGLIEDRALVFLYALAFVGGAVWAYAVFPSALSAIVRSSNYPIATAATRTGSVVLLFLVWRQLTLGMRYPPVTLARGDIAVLLTAPIDRRAVIALRLVRAYASAAAAFAVPMILLGPFLVRIWVGMSPGRLALVWANLSVGWVCLIHWRWGVFHSTGLRRVARVVRWGGYALGGATLLVVFAAWAFISRTAPVFTREAILAAAPGWTAPGLGTGLLAVLSVLAILSWIAVWRSVPRASLEGLVRHSLFVTESVALRREGRIEDLGRLAARMRRGRSHGRRRTIGYRIGTWAIAGKAFTIALRQSPWALAVGGALFVAAVFVYTAFPLLWAKALILSVIATSIAKSPLGSLYRDLGNWAFARGLPLTPREWVDGNGVVVGGWQTVLGWVFVWILFGLGRVASVDIVPLMSFLVAAGWLLAQQAIVSVIAELRADRSMRLAVQFGCLASFAALAGVVLGLLGAGIPPWLGWVLAAVACGVLSCGWRRLALWQMQVLVDRPWEIG
jgi:hypothetical protein